MTTSVVVLYYHRIGSPDPIHLSIPTDLFRRQMDFLFHRKIKSITMAQLVDHVTGTEILQSPSVAITFDDGFRDNFINAFPILKERGLCATIFGISSMVRPLQQPPSEPFRSFNIAHICARRGDFGDFLSRSEMEEMVSSKTFEIHSHTHSHNQVFVSPKLVGLFPDTDRHWGILSAYRNGLKTGRWPIFERKSGLLDLAFFPIVDLIREEMEFAPNAISEATEFIKRRLSPHTRFFEIERRNSYEHRVIDELTFSRQFFQNYHEPNCDVIAWPWGASNEFLVQNAVSSGYRGALRTATGANVSGISPFDIRRFPVKKHRTARFALGFWLRSNPLLARLYGLFHGFI